MKRIVVGAAAAMAVIAVSPSNAQALRVASTGAAPFGEMGFCGDFMSAVAEQAGLEFEHAEPPNLTEIMPALANGDIDVVCSALGGTYLPIDTPPTTANQYRALGLAFTGPMFLNFETMVVLADDDAAYTGFADLEGRPVGATVGATIYLGILADAGITDVRTYPTNAAALDALVAGEVAAVIQGGPSIRYTQSQGQFPNVREVDTYVSQSVIQANMAVRDDDTALLGMLQAALEALKLDGTVAELTARWGLGNPPM